MGKAHSKPLAARHGHAMLCVNRPLLCITVRSYVLQQCSRRFRMYRTLTPMIHFRRGTTQCFSFQYRPLFGTQTNLSVPSLACPLHIIIVWLLSCPMS